MSNRSSSEYASIRAKLPDILSAISGAPATIPRLSTNLVAQDLIPDGVKTEVDNLPVGPYEKANKLIAAVHTTVEFHPNTFNTFVTILRQCDLAPIATVLEDECRRRGGSQPSTASGAHPSPAQTTGGGSGGGKGDNILDIADLVDVMEYVVDLNNPKFTALGLQLGLLQPTMDRLTDAGTPSEYGQKIMEKWLEQIDNVMRRGGPTWNTLANALKKKTVGCPVQGEQILKDLREGKL